MRVKKTSMYTELSDQDMQDVLGAFMRQEHDDHGHEDKGGNSVGASVTKDSKGGVTAQGDVSKTSKDGKTTVTAKGSTDGHDWSVSGEYRHRF